MSGEVVDNVQRMSDSTSSRFRALDLILATQRSRTRAGKLKKTEPEYSEHEYLAIDSNVAFQPKTPLGCKCKIHLLQKNCLLIL